MMWFVLILRADLVLACQSDLESWIDGVLSKFHIRILLKVKHQTGA